jgi:hypothetical protein
MRKRTSLRRWKARCRVGRTIPAEAIVDYSLHRWFRFKLLNPLTDFYVAGDCLIEFDLGEMWEPSADPGPSIMAPFKSAMNDPLTAQLPEDESWGWSRMFLKKG